MTTETLELNPVEEWGAQQVAKLNAEMDAAFYAQFESSSTTVFQQPQTTEVSQTTLWEKAGGALRRTKEFTLLHNGKIKERPHFHHRGDIDAGDENLNWHGVHRPATTLLNNVIEAIPESLLAKPLAVPLKASR